MPPGRKRNPAAVASLVFGILGCMPEVTGLLAIALGIVGLRRARKPDAGGRGLAAAGLALGIVSVVLWSVALALGGFVWSGSGPPRAVARQYLADFSRQDVNALMAASARSVKEPQVRALCARFRTLGYLEDVRFTGMYYHFGDEAWVLNGQARFSNGMGVFVIRVIRQDDQWKVQGFQIRGQWKSQPLPENVEI